MRWWLQTSPPYLMSIDNASVTDMDFSDLLTAEPDLWMVHWLEGKGEVERIDIDGDGNASNQNGLREAVIDVTPYVPLFQQFLERMKVQNLLLTQAQKVQIELIHELFNSKRQLPFHYEVAAGNYWWDASDETMGASTSLGTQNITATVNQLSAAVNKLIDDLNSRFSVVNTQIADVGNVTVSQVNSIVVNGVNATVVNGYNSNASALSSEVGTNIVAKGTALATHLDNTVVGNQDGGNTVNGKLIGTTTPYGDGGYLYYATPGFPNGSPIAHSNISFGNISAYTLAYISSIAPGVFGHVSTIPYTGVGNVSTSNVQWIPWGSTTSVTVTPAEQTAIMNGIALRTNDLNLAKNTKIGEVMALTTVDDVIAYDVLADWPVIDLPPGYPGTVLVIAPGQGASVAVMPGTGTGGGGGIPEAPNDGVTYGRRNLAWNPALAKSNDVLDGGNF